MKKDKIAVIIPTMNLYDRYTKPCIQSVLASNCNVPIDVIVVDNASTDFTVQKVINDFREYGFSVSVHANETNTGCAKAWNKGIEIAKSKGCNYFAIFNSDILVSPNAIQNMYDRLALGDKQLVAGLDISGESPLPESVLDVTAGICRKDYSEAPHPHFSCFMISENTIESVGWFNEIFYPAYFEDNDYHHRIRAMFGNDAAITITTAAFHHFGSKTQNEALGIGTPVVRGDVFKENERRFVELWGSVPATATWNHPRNDQSLSAKINQDQQFEKLA